jgi:hypothetical protein
MTTPTTKTKTITPPPPPTTRTIQWPTAAVLISAVLGITAVLIFADGAVRDALLALLGTLGTVLGAVLPKLIESRSDAS